MGVFDKDLIQKDLSIEDRLRTKILERAEGIKRSIDSASSEGVMEFNRLTEVGSYGASDRSYVWCNRYEAFMDYLTVNLLAMQKEINQHSCMYHDGKIVYIDQITPFSNAFERMLYVTDDPIHVRVPIQYRLVSFLKMPKDEWFQIEINFDITLDRPTRREPWNLHPVIW